MTWSIATMVQRASAPGGRLRTRRLRHGGDAGDQSQAPDLVDRRGPVLGLRRVLREPDVAVGPGGDAGRRGPRCEGGVRRYGEVGDPGPRIGGVEPADRV